jgi:glycosyltransferase involved in cell wall biosynthesis
LDKDFRLSVVIPVYNEIDTIEQILRRVREAPYNTEIICVDDGSQDGSRERLKVLSGAPRLVDQLILHDENRGKGAALRSGFEAATGDIVLIQDADLEYDPGEYPKLIDPIVAGKADVVYGSRFLTGMAHRVLYYWHSIANRMLTVLSNMMTNLNLTDMETCYKVLRREVVSSLNLRERRFGCEPEMTAKIARLGCRVYEVGISYDGRSYDEGKKIGWRDAVWAIYCVLRYRFLNAPPPIDWGAPRETSESTDAATSSIEASIEASTEASTEADAAPAKARECVNA